ncbi:MAG: YfcC family protein [Bacillota bacterium]|uniref:YfcC family protein n=2 Tax=Virgibacillus salarius TaxID=447199 RepID=A0A941IB29_9BACI|nr:MULTISPECIES: AbgT family transporter [Bacillaceae]NAZ08689.1 YfcC family protein [Agaribacter marinus]MBR7795977.1 YfcC family protein [Virgibacillus salarius]MCC2249964.1 AbgT family transporter [Virgibacillus sp. AGTR]MDY7044125.1 AbgT family transporter [Virgibacillus sp. M23]QRZ18219.1 YfcC family protein [Virgibacillus sp. AGTR]
MKKSTNKLKSTKRKLGLPDAYVILFAILIIAAVATYLIPAGTFDRETVNDITTVIPDSYQQSEQQPASFIQIFTAIQQGMIDSAGLIFLVLIIGGAFAVIEYTGAIDALIMKTINQTKDKEYLLIIIVCSLFSIFGALGIIVNAVIAFIPIGIILARSMKLDAVVGVSIIYLGAYAGFNTAFLDPLTTGMAQQIAQVPLFSGIGFRVLIYLTVLASTIGYIWWYASRVKKDPMQSVLGGNRFPKYDEKSVDAAPSKLTGIHKLVLLWLALGIGIYIFGVFQYAWSLNQMAAMFIIIAIGTAIIARINPNELVVQFFNGCKGLVYGALIIGMARSIVVILENGQILDTIVQGMATVMEPFTSVIGAIVMFFANFLFNIIVSSGSGQAVIVMPIMTPLADIMEIPRQVAVQAYKMGDGFSNVITPISGILMANLAIAGVSWVKWIKFVLPLVVIWCVIGIVYLTIAVMIGWGPI